MRIFDNKDCMEGMSGLSNKLCDLAIIDPPYGIKQNSHRITSRTKLAKTTDWGSFDWDNEPPSQEYFDELFRVSKNQIIFGANHFISRMPFDSSAWIVWDKDNGDSHYADCELAWTSFDCAVRKFKYRWNGMLQENMKNKEYRIHPTQKPIALYRWILSKYAKPGDLILDTHAGSASSLIACEQMGFNYIGYEIDPLFYSKSTSRIKDYRSQITMQLPETKSKEILINNSLFTY